MRIALISLHTAKLRHDSQVGRMPWGRGPHHWAGRVPTSDRAFRRAGMDYLDQASIVRHDSWVAFESWRKESRSPLVLFTTRATTSYLDRSYRGDDILMFGRESAGVPEEVHAAATHSSRYRCGRACARSMSR